MSNAKNTKNMYYYSIVTLITAKLNIKCDIINHRPLSRIKS